MLGTTQEMKSESNGEFLKHFIDAVAMGKNIESSIAYANTRENVMYKYVDSSGNEVEVEEFPGYYVGDQLQTLN